jgi:hypothetical protein
MEANPAGPTNSFFVPPRSFKKAALDFAVLSAAVLFIGVGIPAAFFGGAPVPQDVWITLSDGGAVLFDEIGWVLTLYVTVLVGFFVIIIGGQIVGSAAEATRLRGNLGFIGLLLAASSVPLLVYVVSHCLSSDDWAGLIVIIPVGSLVVYLGIYVGRFVVLDDESKLRAIDVQIEQRDTRIVALTKRSNRTSWVVMAITSLVIAAIAFLLLEPGGGVVSWERAFVQLATLYVLSLCIHLVCWGILRESFMDSSKTRYMNWIIFATFLQLFIVFVPMALGAGNGIQLVPASFAFVGGFLVAFTIPRRLQPQWLLNITGNGQAAASARKKLLAKQKADRRERTKLAQTLAERNVGSASLAPPGRWDRMIAALRPPLPNDGES